MAIVRNLNSSIWRQQHTSCHPLKGARLKFLVHQSILEKFMTVYELRSLLQLLNDGGCFIVSLAVAEATELDCTETTPGCQRHGHALTGWIHWSELRKTTRSSMRRDAIHP